jgi:hypothetical protein
MNERPSADRDVGCGPGFATIESSPHALMITPLVLEILAVKR